MRRYKSTPYILKVPELINKFKDLNIGAFLHRYNTKTAPLQWCIIAPAFSDYIFNPLHYLALIEQKANALDQAAPLVGWQLPDVFATLRRLLEARMGKKGKREFVAACHVGRLLCLTVLVPFFIGRNAKAKTASDTAE